MNIKLLVLLTTLAAPTLSTANTPSYPYESIDLSSKKPVQVLSYTNGTRKPLERNITLYTQSGGKVYKQVFIDDEWLTTNEWYPLDCDGYIREDNDICVD